MNFYDRLLFSCLLIGEQSKMLFQRYFSGFLCSFRNHFFLLYRLVYRIRY